MTDTQNIDAVRVGRGGVSLGYRSAAAIVVGIVSTAGGSVAYLDSRFDELERAGYACSTLAVDVAQMGDDIDDVVIKLARLEERVDAGLPAGR